MTTTTCGLPASMALGGDILCSCGNTPSLDGLFPCGGDGRLLTPRELTNGPPIVFYRCDRCGTVHHYADLEAERDAMPFRAGVLELLLCDPWERSEARDAYAAVIAETPDADPVALARAVTAILARGHYNDADESDGREADRERDKGDTYRMGDAVTTGELAQLGADLATMIYKN
jgi:hypothetical protein